jgi:hypothetical protein
MVPELELLALPPHPRAIRINRQMAATIQCRSRAILLVNTRIAVFPGCAPMLKFIVDTCANAPSTSPAALLLAKSGRYRTLSGRQLHEILARCNTQEG